MKLSHLFFVSLLIPLLAMVGCTGDTGPAGPEGPQGPLPDASQLSCADCHDSSNLITGKETEWEESVHATGESYVRGTSSSCAGCHSGNAFALRVDAGLSPDEVASGDTDPTRQDCRACHKIHTTYTMDDFEVRGSDAVALYAVPGATFDGGLGNLCVNCHQPRRVFPEPENGMITGISSHWGPHHGPQSAMLLGVAGAGNVANTPSPHLGVPNTCVQCHMGANLNHTFDVDTDNCQICHPDLDSFDYHNVQTDVQALLDQLGGMLVDAGLLTSNDADGHPAVSEAPVDGATALWNWLYIAHEDKSIGVHNPAYAKALLNASIALMTPQTAMQ
jgi:hypothetical protein